MPVSLIDLPLQQLAVIREVKSVAGGADATALRRMAEIGFLPGEIVKVVARIPGGDPIAVRVASSTFALRRREASSVQVQVLQPNE